MQDIKENRYTLRALARLLAYPDASLRSELGYLAAAIDGRRHCRRRAAPS